MYVDRSVYLSIRIYPYVYIHIYVLDAYTYRDTVVFLCLSLDCSMFGSETFRSVLLDECRKQKLLAHCLERNRSAPPAIHIGNGDLNGEKLAPLLRFGQYLHGDPRKKNAELKGRALGFRSSAISFCFHLFPNTMKISTAVLGHADAT